MKTKDLIEVLKEYNPEAEVKVLVGNKMFDFNIMFGGMGTPTMDTAEEVLIAPNGFNSIENSVKEVENERNLC